MPIHWAQRGDCLVRHRALRATATVVPGLRCLRVEVATGTRTPVIRASGARIGVAHVRRRTIYMAFGGRQRHGASHTLDGVPHSFPTATTATGARSGIPTQNGEARTGAGVILKPASLVKLPQREALNWHARNGTLFSNLCSKTLARYTEPEDNTQEAAARKNRPAPARRNKPVAHRVGNTSAALRNTSADLKTQWPLRPAHR